MEQIAPEAWFESVSGGFRFCLKHRAPESVQTLGTVVYFHPFAEEMNKSRRMAALAARAMAASGWSVVQMDLYGCGDSDGDFGQATWAVWRADMQHACEVLHRESTGELWLWGLRAGALLASSIVELLPPSNLLLWNPVVDGKQHLTQFLRMKMMADRLQSGEGASTKALREDLAAGKMIEVAGYALNPEVSAGLDTATLTLAPSFAGRIVWLEISADPTRILSLPAQQCIDKWRGAAVAVHAEALEGPQFWQTQEITECGVLVERSVSLLQVPA